MLSSRHIAHSLADDYFEVPQVVDDEALTKQELLCLEIVAFAFQ
jgi:hypothetical protein